jgi:hypothetical protein
LDEEFRAGSSGFRVDGLEFKPFIILRAGLWVQGLGFRV